MSYKKNYPTFIRRTTEGASPGYETREIFSYTGNDINLAGSGLTNGANTLDGIRWLIDNFPDSCHGGNEFYGNAWKSGKTIRIKGEFQMLANASGTSRNLNMHLTFYIGTAPYVIASTNNNHLHITQRNVLTSVQFEIFFSCLNFDNGLGYAYFTGWGIYKYNFVNSDSGRLSKVLVPVWSSSNPVSFIKDSLAQTTKIGWNLYSATGIVVDELYLRYLTIEELA
jgi:hypothetical protein